MSGQLKIGALLGYTEVLLTTLIGLVLTPFIISSLGNSEYGLYTLIGSLVGYLSLMDLGLNNTIVRFVSNYRAKGDRVGEEKFLGTTLLIYSIISVIVIVLGLGLYFNLEYIFEQSLTLTEMSRAKIMFLILIFNVAIVLPSNSFMAICTAYEAFTFSKGIRLFRIVLRTVTVYAILSYGGKAVSLVVIDTLYNVLIAVISYLYTRNKLSVKYNFSERGLNAIRPIFSYSLWIMLLVVISQFQWQFGQILLGIYSNTTEVAILSIGVMLGTYYGAFSGVISGLFVPMTARIVREGEAEMQRVFEKIGRYNFVFLMLILLGFYFFGRDFISLWLNDKIYQDSWLIAIIIMGAYTVPLIQSFANSIIEVKGAVKYKFVVYFTCLLLGFILGFYLIPNYSGVGVMLGVSSGWILAQIIMNVFYVRALRLSVYKFFIHIFNKCWICICLSIIAGWSIDRYIVVELSWKTFLLKVLLFAGIYVITAFLFCFNRNERKLIFK